MEELKAILEKFAASDWDLIAIPAQEWLDGRRENETFIAAIMQGEMKCGRCGCDFDALYKRALELIA